MKKICMVLSLLLLMLPALGAPAEQTDPAQAYEAAMALYQAGEYDQAITAFEALGSYRDSAKMLANSKWYDKEQRYANARALYKAERYEEAQALFAELGSFEESKKYAAKCASAIQARTYAQANSLYEADALEEALEMYQSLGKYQKSESRVREITDLLAAREQAAHEQQCYQQALQAKAEGRLEQARDLLIESGDTLDATDQLYQILEELAPAQVYQRALADLSRGQLEDAVTRFETLGDYGDSPAQAALAREALLARRYQEAQAEEDPNRAMALFLALGSYQDSAARAEALRTDTGILGLYAAAEALRRENRPAEAAQAYALCEGYKDSAQQARQMEKDAESSARFEQAHILTELWRLDEANAIYQALGNYSYASRMGIQRISTGHLRDDATTPLSETFTAPDGTTHRYRIYKGVPRWIEAKAFCRALGGHLATLTSEQENRFVHQFMMDNGFKTAFFGLEDEERDHTWEWVTGEPVEYTNWNRGEPSYSPRERYGMYFYKHLSGTWNDSHFYEHAETDPGCSFICEWDD